MCEKQVVDVHTDLSSTKGQGHSVNRPSVLGAVKVDRNDYSVVSGLLYDDVEFDADYDVDYDVKSNDNVILNCGLPLVSVTILRQDAIRCHKNQDGGYEWEIVLPDAKDWDFLPDYIGITKDVSICVAFSHYYKCEVPMCVVEVVPGNYIPVFDSCIGGNCHCVYIVQGAVTQLRPCQFVSYLCAFDLVTKDDWYVVTGVCRGFRIIDKDCDTSYLCDNYSTTTKGDTAVEMTDKIKNELRDGKVRMVSKKPRCVHSLGCVSKPDGSIRPITDCSSPDNININAYMDNSCDKFSYHSVDDVVHILDQFDFCSVSDISSAYRSVNVLPAHRDYQGFKWNIGNGDSWFQDLCLCFGLRSAPYIFTQISDFCVKCVNYEGVSRCINYLDDFIIIDSDYTSCKSSQDALHLVLQSLGFKIASKKVTLPSQVVKFLGIIIDSVHLTLSIGEDKLERVLKCVRDLKDKRWCSYKLLEQTAGLLAHCATVVKGGRTFSRRIYNLLKDVDSGCRRVILTDLAIMDLRWWSNFLTSFNGKARMFDKSVQSITLVTDASSTSGFGAHSEYDYFWGFWNVHETICPHHEKAPTDNVFVDHINIGELWPVVVALHRCCHVWKDSILNVITDNTQVYYALATGRGKNATTMAWLRELFWVCAFHNIHIVPSWIRSEDNTLADALSRLKNPDCMVICEDYILDFGLCCRPRLTETRMGPCSGLVLG